jgi:mRNA interferase MazF
MGKFVKGDIVIINFPFSDLSGAKRRPALVVADLKGDDVILCQITGVARKDGYSILLDEKDYVEGKLSSSSVVRPNRVFTANESIIRYKACSISNGKCEEAIDKLVEVLKL